MRDYPRACISFGLSCASKSFFCLLPNYRRLLLQHYFAPSVTVVHLACSENFTGGILIESTLSLPQQTGQTKGRIVALQA